MQPKPMTILVVDDEKNYRIVLARLFESAGYRVLLAECPKSAMLYLQEYPVSLVLTDQRMAGMHGLQFCQKVHDEFGGVPCILFTANRSQLSRQAMADAGIDACLDKPFDNHVVLELVARIMQAQSLDSSPGVAKKQPQPGPAKHCLPV